MKSKWIWAMLLVVLGAAVYGGTVLATPSSGFTSTTLAKSQLGKLDIKGESKADHWKVKLKTKGLSDLYVQSNILLRSAATALRRQQRLAHPSRSQPDHRHAGHGDRLRRRRSVVHAARLLGDATNSFVDVGGGDVHSDPEREPEEARTVVVQFVPTGAARRNDAPAPGNCPF